jgi:fibrillarin-like pre-rRNA processing protein
MKKTENKGVFLEKNRLFTENPPSCKGFKIYNERLITYKNKEFRSWNPNRSKLAAGILKGMKVTIKPNYKILYLGAATGTTVSHVSDIVIEGIIYAVESSPIAMHELLKVSEKRTNIIPILEDAFHPQRFSIFVSKVDLVYQDISQRNQAEIFIKNVKNYLKNNGKGLIMVKARSVDISKKPKEVFKKVCSQIEAEGFNIDEITELSPYEKDHAAILIST